jgi:hypothetical protein
MATCGLNSCQCRAKEYGVCGRHKQSKYKSNDPSFLYCLEIYNKVFQQYIEECNNLEQKGHSILQIQSCYNYNLAAKPVSEFPNHLSSAGNLLERTFELEKLMHEKYDRTLVSNACVRVRHRYGPQCTCEICMLGK